MHSSLGWSLISLAWIVCVGSATEAGVIRLKLKRLNRIETHRTPSFLQISSRSSPVARSRPAEQLAYGVPPIDIYGEVRVGTPPQIFTVAIDTGSGNLLLTSDACRSMGCLGHQMYSASQSSSSQPVRLYDAQNAAQGKEPAETVLLDISTGEAEGEIVTDKVCLADDSKACAPTGLVQMTSMTSEPFSTFPYDGILGVALTPASVGKQFNLIGNLVDARLIKRNIFSIWLANEADKNDDSEILLGDLSENRMASELLWLPLSSPGGMWQVKMTDFTVDNVKANLCGKDGCQVAFDTGTNAIAAPKGVIVSLLSRLDIQEDCSNWHDLPNLGFVFKGMILNIEKNDYVKRVADRCYHQLLGLDLPPPKKDLVLLGDPFLRKYYSIYDGESLKVGLAFSKHRPALQRDDNDNVMLENVAADPRRLMVPLETQ